MSVNSKMTAIANRIRALSGLTGTMGVDAMASNLETANSEVNAQAGLLNQALTLIEGKAAGGSGSNSGPYSYAEEFIWTAPTEITASSSTVSIPHSLGVEPDGFLLMNLELTCDREDAIVSSVAFDRSMYHPGISTYVALIPAFDSANNLNFGYNTGYSFSDFCTSANIKIGIQDFYGTVVIPAGKQYRVLVYKR